MARSSGTYTAPTNSWNPAVEGTEIDEGDWNSILDDLEAALTESVYTSGLGSTDNRLARVDGTDTKKLQGSAATLDDSGNLSGIANLAATGYADVTEMAAPGSPSANVLRLYVADDSGTTRLYAKDSAGTTYTLTTTSTALLDAISSTRGVVLYRGASGWSALSPGTSGQFLKTLGAGADPEWSTPAGAGDLVAANNLSDVASEATAFRNLAEGISSTQGTILYRDASQWTVLSPGTSGQFLKTLGAGANPAWDNPAGSGDVTAASSFGTDNRLIRSDGTVKGVQSSAVTVDDSGNVSGVGTLAMSGALTVDEVAAPSTPASGKVAVYAKSDGKLYIKDDAGTETDLTSSGGSGSPSVPQGRLTLSTGVPVMTTSVTGATTIYYTPYVGVYVPIYNGTTWTMTDVGGELSQTTSDSTKSPAAVTTNSNYDLFVWNDAGTYRCTRGPAWTSDTGRGTGAATTELERVNGILVNKIAITNGPAAQRGTYVGTVRTNGSSQCDFIFPTIATTPVAGAFNVWNMYHRRTVIGTLGDSTATWTYNATAWREIAANTTARCAFVIGWEEDAVDCKMTGFSTSASTGDFALLGFGVDSTTAQSGVAGSHVNTASNSSPNSTAYYAGTFLGYHYIAMIERVTAAQTATIFGQSVSTQVTAAVYTLQM